MSTEIRPVFKAIFFSAIILLVLVMVGAVVMVIMEGDR